MILLLIFLVFDGKVLLHYFEQLWDIFIPLMLTTPLSVSTLKMYQSVLINIAFKVIFMDNLYNYSVAPGARVHPFQGASRSLRNDAEVA